MNNCRHCGKMISDAKDQCHDCWQMQEFIKNHRALIIKFLDLEKEIEELTTGEYSTYGSGWDAAIEAVMEVIKG